MLIIPNEMILASAGSGKTWQLTNRYIALMATQLRAGEEVCPERIIAVTFTRKAAGEFFDSIVEKLALAALDPEEGQKLGADRSDPLSAILSELSCDEYRTLLKVFIRKMPHLFLGTLDSFFANILRSFPAEFGLAGDFEIIDQHLEGMARDQVYRSVFQRQPEFIPGKGQSQKEFMEAFRQATFGREESKIRNELDRFVDDLHEVYLHASFKDLWGNPEVIWKTKCPWLEARTDLPEAFERLFDDFSQQGISLKQLDVWEHFRDEMTAHIPGTRFETKAGYLMEKILDNWDGIVAENATVVVARSGQELSPIACNILFDIVSHLVGSELRIRLKRTQGVWQLLNLYEEKYAEQVRRQGQLTFRDLELLLSGHEFGQHGNVPVLSQLAGDADRLQVDYRLDARYDHWLLDEFQDTNYLQWSVIANLVDEAVQDTSNTRSLFQVGDIKQAIYAWRGGDTRLFHDIYSRYNAHEKRIHNRLLNISWRSGHDVIETVNRIFGEESVLRAIQFPTKARKRWQWQPHEVASPNREKQGISMLINPHPYTEGDRVIAEDRFAVVVELLEEVQPVKRGLSCAILVQSNKVGRQLVDYIRAQSSSGIPVMSESDIPVATDNALNRLIISLLTHAAHPGDTLSWHHLCMTPYREYIEEERLDAEGLRERISRIVFRHGFETLVRQVVTDLSKVLPENLDTFSASRAEDLALAARVYDISGSRDIEEFLAYARSYTVREPDTRSAVQVMTIHKSKGLTFDMAILPDLEGNSLHTVRKGIGVKRDANREVEWVYDLPQKAITEVDETLGEFRKDREAEAAYEALCKYYVAMTRARYANYLITNPRKRNSFSENFVKMLEVALEDNTHEDQIGSLPVDVLYRSNLPTSNSRWFEEYQLDNADPPSTLIRSRVPVSRPRKRVNRRTPSTSSEKSQVTPRLLFSRSGKQAREFGTLVHALLEDIEWIEDFQAEKARKKWMQLTGWTPEVLQSAIEHTLSCVTQSAVRNLLRRPTPQSECWREKSFEVLLEDEWLSGTFDRVIIERDMFDNVVTAQIIDFKTDRISSPSDRLATVETYRPQMETYREVLQRMLGIRARRIRMSLVFTNTGEVAEVG